MPDVALPAQSAGVALMDAEVWTAHGSENLGGDESLIYGGLDAETPEIRVLMGSLSYDLGQPTGYKHTWTLESSSHPLIGT